jgi:hypothetical protein
MSHVERKSKYTKLAKLADNSADSVLYRFQSSLNRGVCGNLVPLGSEIL